MDEIPFTEPLKARVSFNYEFGLGCFISSDLFNHFVNANTSLQDGKEATDTVLVSVLLGSYRSYSRSKLVYCRQNPELDAESVLLPAQLFGVLKGQPAVDWGELWPYEGSIPVLDSIAIATQPILYDRLMELPDAGDRFNFVKLKASMDTSAILHAGDILLDQWCHVADCSPQHQGLIKSNVTNVFFIRDGKSQMQHIADPMADLRLIHNPSKRLPLKCLNSPVKPELLRPHSLDGEDDSLFVFASCSLFLELGMSSGTYVTLVSEGVSKMAKLMVLLSPNDLEPGFLYVSPRLMAIFRNCNEVQIEKITLATRHPPVASMVSLARIGSWNNCQKIFENIISSNLIAFLTQKNRLLKVGDQLPITFDSNLAPFYSKDFTELDINGQDDSIAWFRVETVEVEDKIAYRNEVKIDSKKTTLLTQSLVAGSPVLLPRCDYVSYYGLPSIFRYDLTVFDYAKRFQEIAKVAFKLYDAGAPSLTSVILQSSTPGVGKSTLVRFVARELGVNLIEIDCMSITSAQGSIDAMNKTVGYLRAKLEPLLAFVAPSIVYLSHLDSAAEKADELQDLGSARLNRSLALELASVVDYCNSQGAIFVGSVEDVDNLPDALRSKIHFTLDIPVPNELQRQHIFEWSLRKQVLNHNNGNHLNFAKSPLLSISKLAQRSAGLSPYDIKSIVQNAMSTSLSKALSNDHLQDAYISNGGFIAIEEQELLSSIEKARDEFSDSIGAPKIPNVSWADIGGMDMVKGEIMDTIDLPLKHPELFSSELKKRSGILFYGPPGTGKTLLAKAIATNFSLNFFSVKGPELLNMYIGESEANVRRVFQKARDAKPCVIFFDELDSVAPKRGNQGDSGGVMDRIVSQLLAELDGMSTDCDGVFVIGATNRPDLLDEALLRPGRFDKLLYLGISDTNEKQENVLRALSRKFTLDQDVDLAKIADICPFNYTGADFYALCSDAMLNAMTRVSKDVDKKVLSYSQKVGRNVSTRYWFDKIATEEDSDVAVKMEDFLNAQANLTPSVSQEELAHYLKVKSNFEDF
ncbi:LADA_0D00342g1_1 [Lachancea dasiensis]|uniref:Peroxisomal ATPase PEX6 n=1 Tax=Lachancea dasiensis TaxID=1072105 RepID=A0A1G4J378_9SACH|nr:LADA_0D00342g1_1 [Lachancea dasiensis]